jgi:phosphoribosyl-ATP pyrophosphohydrolase/phosphoribosyl-AMP cyclohydrolase
MSNELIPAIVRDANSGEVLMLAWMNEESLRRTKETGETWFWSRSRNELWHKGATSGNTQKVIHIAEDCDRDALLITVEPDGPACHNGTTSCFEDTPRLSLEQLMSVLRDRYDNRPEGSYTAKLFNEGLDRILKKIGEEATEVVIAAKGEGRDRLISEITDLVFHLSVLMTNETIGWRDIHLELDRRS